MSLMIITFHEQWQQIARLVYKVEQDPPTHLSTIIIHTPVPHHVINNVMRFLARNRHILLLI